MQAFLFVRSFVSAACFLARQRGDDSGGRRISTRVTRRS